MEDRLRGYDACFNCAGVSSAGMSEAEYTRLAYDMVLSFAETLARLNPKMIFTHVTGAGTDGTEKGRTMWARVKGRTENALARLPLGEVYNFRPGLMKPTKGQPGAAPGGAPAAHGPADRHRPAAAWDAR